MIVATHNLNKLEEFQLLFSELSLDQNRLTSLQDHPDLPEIEETGKTFEENARLKAETIAEITGELTLADDSGLMVKSLGGAPGIYSARYSGPHATDQTNNQKLLKELENQDDRQAQFVCCIVVSYPNKPSLVIQETVDGIILDQPSGDAGFGYDPLFYYPPLETTFAALTRQEKNQVSHRGKAIQALKLALPQWLKENGLT